MAVPKINSRHTLRNVLLIFFIAFSLRAAFLFLLSENLTSGSLLTLDQRDDSAQYISASRYLLGHQGGSADALLFRGLGYPLFLALIFFIFGNSARPVIFIQILLSGTSCVLIYLIAKGILSKHRYADILAGLIAAFSLTSISLSVRILSDTLSNFLVIYSIFLIIKGLEDGRLRNIIFAGAVMGYAALVRPTNTFMAFSVMLMVLITPKAFFSTPKKDVIKKAAIMTITAIAILSIWSFRNYVDYGLFTPSTNGAYTALYYWTASSIANELKWGQSLYELPSNHYATINPAEGVPNIRDYWQRELGLNMSDMIDDNANKYRRYVGYISYSFRDNPATMTATLLKNAVINTLEVDYYYWDVIDLTPGTRALYKKILYTIAFLVFVLFWSSVFTFWFRVKDYRVILLVGLYIYFALMSGFAFWQGSRLFSPAQISWTILISGPIEVIVNHLVGQAHRLKRHFSNN